MIFFDLFVSNPPRTSRGANSEAVVANYDQDGRCRARCPICDEETVVEWVMVAMVAVRYCSHYVEFRTKRRFGRSPRTVIYFSQCVVN